MKSISYLMDRRGKRVAVVVPLHGNEEMIAEFLEDLYGHKMIQERSNEATINTHSLLKSLKRRQSRM